MSQGTLYVLVNDADGVVWGCSGGNLTLMTPISGAWVRLSSLTGTSTNFQMNQWHAISWKVKMAFALALIVGKSSFIGTLITGNTQRLKWMGWARASKRILVFFSSNVFFATKRLLWIPQDWSLPAGLLNKFGQGRTLKTRTTHLLARERLTPVDLGQFCWWMGMKWKKKPNRCDDL